MPRNPDKIPCSVPNCRNWAMRGHDRCRPHRDAELGPRNAGAPLDNLNALRQGHRAQPLSPPDLQRLTSQLVEEPDHLPLHLSLLLRDLHGRTGDPFNTLIALRALLRDLLPLVAGRLFTAELKTLLRSLLPSHGRRFLDIFNRNASLLDPQSGLILLRTIAKQVDKMQKPAPPDPAGREP